MSTSPQEMNARVIEEFRANAGRVGGAFAHTRLLLLHHVGARTGARRINPLAYLADGDRYVIFASKAGAAENPDWYHNLRAHPDASIEVGGRTVEVSASEADGDERDRLYALQVAAAPRFAEYQARTRRRIPVIVLTPRGAAPTGTP